MGQSPPADKVETVTQDDFLLGVRGWLPLTQVEITISQDTSTHYSPSFPAVSTQKTPGKAQPTSG